MQKFDPLDIIDQFYPPGPLRDLLIRHSAAVAEKALAMARRMSRFSPDLGFIREAAMVHDIGIFLTNAEAIGCRGDLPYVCHGYLGRELLENLGFPRHARVCECHVGAGLSVDEIDGHGLPLPRRDMVPETIEEQIICYADKFFSKKFHAPDAELPLDTVKRKIKSYGPTQSARFEAWVAQFEIQAGTEDARGKRLFP